MDFWMLLFTNFYGVGWINNPKYFKHVLNQKIDLTQSLIQVMSNRRKHVFPLNKLKQGIEVFELLSFDLFKLSL